MTAHTLIHGMASKIMMKNVLGLRPSKCPLTGNDKSGKVGEVILKLPEEQREILKQLTSKDTGNIRLF